MRQHLSELHGAAQAEDWEKIARLLEGGADVNLRDHCGITPLMDAAREGHTESVRLLLDWGAEVNLQDNSGDTALMEAVSGNHLDTARLLLRRGANPNIKNKIGHTPVLTTVIYDDRLPILTLLLESGADSNLPTRGEPVFFAGLGDGEIVRLFLAHGADLSLKDKHGRTVLEHAQQECCHDAMPLLKQALKQR